MAINDFQNIENINLNLDSTAQLIASKDLTIFKTGAKNITDFGMSNNDVIEFRIYDISNNLLQQTGGNNVRYIHKDDLSKYLLSTTDPITQELIYNIDVEKLIYEAGYGNGQFKVSFNFLKNYLGNEDKKQRVWIHEVSPSRTEIRIMPLLGNDEILNQKITNRYNSFLDKANELREVITNIENTIDSIELQISDLIDNYFISTHGKVWLDKVIADYKFNHLSYTSFKTKVFSDFKNSVYYQLNGKEFNINSANYGNKTNTPFNIDEFYKTNDIISILQNRLHESIEYNSSFITQYDIPQIVKDYTQSKTDSQLLQSLLDTTYTTKSNLTQNDKLGIVNKTPVTIDTTPITTIKEDVIVPTHIADPLPVETTTPIYSGGGGGSYSNGTYSMYTGLSNYIDFNTNYFK